MSIPHICHFFYTGRIFENQILHPKKRLKTPKTLKMSLKKSNVCSFFHSIWKNLHLTVDFYTGTAGGASDKYEVCLENHLRKKHGKTLVISCDKCATVFEDGKALNRHMNRKTDCRILPKVWKLSLQFGVFFVLLDIFCLTTLFKK